MDLRIFTTRKAHNSAEEKSSLVCGWMKVGEIDACRSCLLQNEKAGLSHMCKPCTHAPLGLEISLKSSQGNQQTSPALYSPNLSCCCLQKMKHAKLCGCQASPLFCTHRKRVCFLSRAVGLSHRSVVVGWMEVGFVYIGFKYAGWFHGGKRQAQRYTHSHIPDTHTLAYTHTCAHLDRYNARWLEACTQATKAN